MPTKLFLLALLHEFLRWCELSWQKQYFVSDATSLGFNISRPDSVYIHIHFFSSLISFLAALPLFTWCLSPSFSPLKRRNNRQTKSFPVQQCWQYDPAHYRYLISAVYKGHRNILSFYAACLSRAASTCDPDFLKVVIFAFQKREIPYQKRANAVA